VFDLTALALNVPIFLLVACRAGGIMLAAPVLSSESLPAMIRLAFTVGAAGLQLELDAQGPPVIFGEEGRVRKGDDPSAASHYVTFPRMATTGTLKGAGAETLHGLSWMDHEFSSSQLAPDQVGWDWAGLQLRDGRSLMVYRLRRADGSQDPWSTVSEVDASGRLALAQALVITLVVVEVVVISTAAGIVQNLYRLNGSLDIRKSRNLKG